MKVIKLLKKNLKKPPKLITYYLTLSVNKTMITLVTQHLKMVVAEEGVLVTLISLVIFQIFLRIFLEKGLVEVVEEIGEQIIEDQI